MFEYVSLSKIEPVPYCFSAFRDRTDVNVSCAQMVYWFDINVIILNRYYIITSIWGQGNPYGLLKGSPII